MAEGEENGPPGLADDPLHIPGRDPNPRATVERMIKLGWTLVGIILTGSVFAALLKASGYLEWPATFYQSLRIVSITVAVINIGIWMWFPLDDLSVLRHWVRTRNRRFPGQTAEFWSIMLAMALLLALIGGAMYGPVTFGVAGMAVYAWNIVGFIWVRRIVADVASESYGLYSAEAEPWRTPLLAALAVITWYWDLRVRHPLAGWQQQRHVAMFGAFIIVALLGCDTGSGSAEAAYLIGIGTIVSGEVSLAAVRVRRDRALHTCEEALAGA